MRVPVGVVAEGEQWSKDSMKDFTNLQNTIFLI
jgi:hypothetical protein